VTVRLQWAGTRVAYLGWSGGTSTPAPGGADAPLRVDMDPAVARALGLREGQTVCATRAFTGSTQTRTYT
jgi:hypothetical protein